MSWSVTTAAGNPDQILDRINALEPFGDPFAARDDQVKAAKAAAVSLLESGCVGKGEAFYVTISGHANENHEPVSGYANDTVAVSISQVESTYVDQFDKQQAANQQGLQ